jgi:hypothetical protein
MALLEQICEESMPAPEQHELHGENTEPIWIAGERWQGERR